MLMLMLVLRSRLFSIGPSVEVRGKHVLLRTPRIHSSRRFGVCSKSKLPRGDERIV